MIRLFILLRYYAEMVLVLKHIWKEKHGEIQIPAVINVNGRLLGQNVAQDKQYVVLNKVLNHIQVRGRMIIPP